MLLETGVPKVPWVLIFGKSQKIIVFVRYG
jgi:hypothetical protein